MVAMTAPDIFQYKSLTRLQEVTTTLAKIPGIGQVRSLTSMDNVRGSEWGIEMSPLIKEIPTSSTELATLRKEIISDPMYSGSMVSLADATLVSVGARYFRNENGPIGMLPQVQNQLYTQVRLVSSTTKDRFSTGLSLLFDLKFSCLESILCTKT